MLSRHARLATLLLLVLLIAQLFPPGNPAAAASRDSALATDSTSYLDAVIPDPFARFPAEVRAELERMGLATPPSQLNPGAPFPAPVAASSITPPLAQESFSSIASPDSSEELVTVPAQPSNSHSLFLPLIARPGPRMGTLITPEQGGVVRFGAGELEVRVQPQAVAAPTRFHIHAAAFGGAALTDTAQGLRRTSYDFDITAAEDLTAAPVTQFIPRVSELHVRDPRIADVVRTQYLVTPTVDLVITYDPARLSGVNERDLRVAYWDEVASEWVPILTLLDTATNTARAPLSHLTRYALMALPAPASGLTVVLDPDHGGADPGGRVTSPLVYAATEKTYNLATAQAVRDQLDACGVRVEMTRSDDSNLSAADRVAFINGVAPDASVTIAYNILRSQMSFTTGTGAEAWAKLTPQNVAFANLILGEVVAQSGGGLPSRGVKNAAAHFFGPLAVPMGVDAAIPHAQAELAFMDNFYDRALMDQYSDIFVNAVSNALLDQLGVSEAECERQVSPWPPSPFRFDGRRSIGYPRWANGANRAMVLEPVLATTGNQVYAHQDLMVPNPGMPFRFERVYNSGDPYCGPLGCGWAHSFNHLLWINENGEVDLRYPDGSVAIFTPSGVGFSSEPGVLDTLSRDGDAYVLTTRDQTRYRFEVVGDPGYSARLAQIIERSGNRFALAYDGAGNLTQITDPVGREYQLAYNGTGLLTSLTDPIGRVVRYGYDDQRNLTSVTDARGGVTSFAYDDAHRLLRATDPMGVTFIDNTYDAEGRLVSQRDGGGVTGGLTFGDEEVTFRDNAGQATIYQFDDRSRPTRVTDPLGRAETFAYDDDDNLVEQVDAAGGKTTRSYDERGNLLSVTDPLGRTTTYTYDGRNNLLTETDPLGYTTRYSYSPQGNVTRVEDPAGNVVTIAYTAAGLPERIVNARGLVLTYRYNDQGQLVEVRDGAGNTTTHTYDAVGRQVSTTDPLGRIMRYGYDALDQPTTVTDARGNKTTFAYDASGNLVSVTDRAGATTTYVYNEDDQVVQMIDALGGVTSYTYDALYRRTSTADPLGRITRLTYDAVGNVTAITDPRGGVTKITYDDLDRPVTITDPSGAVTTMAYDAAGQLLRVTDPLGNTTAYAYNANGWRTTATDALGAITRFAYDELGNLVTLTDALGGVSRFAYDPMGALTRTTAADGAVTGFALDPWGRVLERTDPLGHKARFVYDAVGNLLAATDENGNTTTFAYDANDNLVARTDALGRVVRHTYDAEDRQLTTVGARGQTWRTVYDAIGRLVETVDPLGNRTRSTFDAADNLVTLTDALGGVVRFSYDANDNLVLRVDQLGREQRFTYDANDRPLTATDARGAVTRYAYSARGELVRVTDPLGHQAFFAYDALGRLIETTDPRGFTATTAYDALGRPTEAVDPRGATIQYTYDAVGRPVVMTDPRGSEFRFRYDARGQLVETTDPLGGVAKRAYDPAGNFVSAMDARGSTTAFTYDAVHNLTRRVDPLGQPWQYAYDADDNLAETRTPLGFISTTVYDSLSRPVTVTDAEGGVTTWSYDALGRRVVARLPNGGERQFTFDAASQLVSDVDPLGNRTKYAYDPAGNLTERTDALGFAQRYVYDLRGQLTEATNALSHRVRYAYDEAGNLTESTDARGGVTRFAYDETSNLVQVTDALGGVSRWEFDLNGNLTAQIDQLNAATRYEYDALNRRVAEVRPRGQRATFAYDPVGNLTTITDALGQARRSTYDARDQLITQTDALGATWRFTYDADGRPQEQRDPLGRVTRYQHDGLSRLTAVVDALGGTTRYTYDPIGALTAITDANGNTTRFEVDLLGRSTAEVNPVGSRWAYRYDAVGNVVGRTDAKGVETRYEYDAERRLTRTTAPNHAVALAYDPNNNLVRMVDGTGTTTAAYDALNRLTAIGRTEGILAGTGLGYGYDPVGRRTSLTYPDGRAQTYAYDANGWLTSITDPRGGETRYTNNDVGLPVRIARPNATETLSTYDANNRTLEERHQASDGSGRVISRHRYTYDAVGNVVQANDGYGQGSQERQVTRNFAYDALNRLVRYGETPDFQPADVVREQYTYDAVGNRLTLTTDRQIQGRPLGAPRTINYSYDTANRLLSAGATSYRYDANGNRIEELTPGERRVTYRYDVEDRMVGALVEAPRGNGSWREESESLNRYDGFGRRVTKDVRSRGVSKQTRYTMDGWGYDVLAENSSPGNTAPTFYYRDPLTILSREDTRGSGQGQQWWYYQDAMGSVTALANHQGQSVHTYRYEAFGGLIDVNGKPTDADAWGDPHNHMLWGGKELDEVVNLSYYGARHYDATTGTWLTGDRYRGTPNDPTSLHRYGYVGNNPGTLADWYGFWGINLGFAKLEVNNGSISGSVNFGSAFQASASYNANTGSVRADVKVDTPIVKGDAYYQGTRIDGGYKHDAGVTGAMDLGGRTYGVNAHGSVAHGCNAQRGCYFDAAGRMVLTRDNEVIFDKGGQYSYSSNRSYRGPSYASLSEVEQRFNAAMPKLQGYISEIDKARALRQFLNEVRSKTKSQLVEMGVPSEFVDQTGIDPLSEGGPERIIQAYNEKLIIDALAMEGVSEEFIRGTGIAITPDNVNRILEAYNDSKPWYEKVGSFVGGVWNGVTELGGAVIDIGSWGVRSINVFDQNTFTKQWEDNVNTAKSVGDWSYRSSLLYFVDQGKFQNQWSTNWDTGQAVVSNAIDQCKSDKARCTGQVLFEIIPISKISKLKYLGKTDTLTTLEKFATKADTITLPPNTTARVAGTLKHSEFADLVRGLKNSSVKAEVRYFNGAPVQPGVATPTGSVRLDVVEYDGNGNVIAVYDLKTGSAGLTSGRIAEIRSHLPNNGLLPNGQLVPVIEVRP